MQFFPSSEEEQQFLEIYKEVCKRKVIEVYSDAPVASFKAKPNRTMMTNFKNRVVEFLKSERFSQLEGRCQIVKHHEASKLTICKRLTIAKSFEAKIGIFFQSSTRTQQDLHIEISSFIHLRQH